VEVVVLVTGTLTRVWAVAPAAAVSHQQYAAAELSTIAATVMSLAHQHQQNQQKRNHGHVLRHLF
jgi:hypothetical protein